MIYIIHRINNIKELIKIPNRYGVEIDLRSFKNDIILNHEPYKNGEKLIDYIKHFNHRFIVANIKEAGIENDVIKILKKKTEKFFLLDCEFPYIHKNSIFKKNYLSIRFSETESISTVEKYKKKINWVWVDTFKKLPINNDNIKLLNKFKKCLVCPERWGREKDIIKYKKYLKRNNFKIDGIMTSLKCVKFWESAN
jgi:hypothetical protein